MLWQPDHVSANFDNACWHWATMMVGQRDEAPLLALVLLQIHKVASYCMSKLQELNIHLDMRPQYLRRPPHAPPEQPPEGLSGRPALELLCNGMVRAGGVACKGRGLASGSRAWRA